jgi:UDP-GlcNAc:undecaprenyl-phosphate GlcNAc-1-phosphate transferase
MKKKKFLILIGLLLVVALALGIFRQPQRYFPFMEVTTPDQIRISFLLQARNTIESCDATLGKITRAAVNNCASCRIQKAQCLTDLSSANKELLLSEKPADLPTARMTNGVIFYNSENPESALAACKSSEKLGESATIPIRCYGPGAARTLHSTKQNLLNILPSLLIVLLAAALASTLTCWLIVKYEHLHAHFSLDQINTGPQKFHTVPTPRIGGLGIIIGLLVANTVILILPFSDFQRGFSLLLFSSVPAFLGGLIEDITKKVGVLERLLLAMVSGALGAWLLGGVLTNLDVPLLDQALLWAPFAVVFTAFAISGITNAINIIDGYNGLAAGYVVIALAGMACVAYAVGDIFILCISISLIGSLMGFIKWNWPNGRVFLGDGGAYLIGFLIAELCVMLVVRNPMVSPWFPVALLIYPIFETLFTIYRRKILRRKDPGQPDRLHLHQLVYTRLAKRNVESRVLEHSIQRNSAVAPYFWIANAFIFVPLSAYAHNSTFETQIICAGACLIYLSLYKNWSASGL